MHVIMIKINTWFALMGKGHGYGMLIQIYVLSHHSVKVFWSPATMHQETVSVSLCTAVWE